MKNITTAFRNHLKSTPTTVCTMWIITRLDKQVFTFTEHDRDVTYDGRVYKSTGGFNKSAMKSSGTLATDNMEVNGFLSDDTIPDDELRNGAFDYAEVDIFLVNYNDLSMGICKLRHGYFGEVRTAPSGMFLVELRGLVDLLSQKIGDVYAPECRVDLGSTKCGVSLIPPLRQPRQVYGVGQRVIAAVDGFNDFEPSIFIGPANGGYEAGVLAPWDGNFIGISQGDLNIQPPPFSNYFVRFNNLTGNHVSQYMPLITGNSTEALVNSGVMKLRVEGQFAGIETGSTAAVSVSFWTQTVPVDLAFSTVTIDLGVCPFRNWKSFSKVIPIPPNAKSCKIHPFVSDLAVFSMLDVGFDTWRCLIEFPNDGVPDFFDNYPVFGGVEFECTTLGIASDGYPVFDPVIGNTTTDGTVVWTARKPVHMFTDVLVEDAATSLTLKVTSIDMPDDWFEWGVIKFWSGENVGRAVECMGWDNDTKILTLAMPLPYQGQAGDYITVHTGCDKSRGVCFSKFANILNFRAEPDVPGLNQYFKVAGLRK